MRSDEVAVHTMCETLLLNAKLRDEETKGQGLVSGDPRGGLDVAPPRRPRTEVYSVIRYQNLLSLKFLIEVELKALRLLNPIEYLPTGKVLTGTALT